MTAVLTGRTLCHCESCRRAAGAHAVGWLTVRSAELRYAAAAPREFDGTICSLEHPEKAAPADHIWMQDAPSWDRPADGLPQYPAGRTPT